MYGMGWYICYTYMYVYTFIWDWFGLPFWISLAAFRDKKKTNLNFHPTLKYIVNLNSIRATGPEV